MSQVRSRWYGIIVTLKRLAVPMLCPNLEDLSIQTLWQIIFYRNLLISFTIHLCCTSPSEKHLKDFESRECCNIEKIVCLVEMKQYGLSYHNLIILHSHHYPCVHVFFWWPVKMSCNTTLSSGHVYRFIASIQLL